MGSIAADLRYGLRLLRRSPGFTTVTVVTLALGIGANTVIFSTVETVLLRSLPYGDPERLVMVWEDASYARIPRNTPAPANYVDWKARNRSFLDMAATRGASANLTVDGPPELVLGRAVTPNFFAVLQVLPALGRTFSLEEERSGAPVVVISDGLWQRRYSGDPSVIGRTITMDGAAQTVIGVMPRGFAFRNRDIDYWIPIRLTPALLAARNSHFLNVVARLRPAASVESARAEMRSIAAQLTTEYPDTNAQVGAVVVPMRDEILGNTRMQLIVLMAAAGAVLLIACANLASLLLSRALGRRGELAVRAALGASRGALVRQLVTEAMLLSGLGGVVAIAMAPLGMSVVSRMIPSGIAATPASVLDGRLLAFTLLLSAATGIAFSVIPALQMARPSLTDALRLVGRGSLGAGQRLMPDGLVVLQVAAALVLLVSAGLMVRTLINLRAIDVGFTPDHLLTVRTTLPQRKYSDAAARNAFYERVIAQVRAQPGVRSAAYASTLPFQTQGNTIFYGVEGRDQPANVPDDALLRTGTSDYLRTLGVQLVEGRLIDDRDGRDAPLVIVINETLARTFWPHESATGHRMQISSSQSPWRTIVGVVRDVRERGYEPALKPGVYLPYAQVPDTWAMPEYLVIRTETEPLAMTAIARAAVKAVDPDQPISTVRTMDDIIDRDVADRTQQATLLGAFSTLALLLATVGLYGVLSYTVTQRRREIGVRLALGAAGSDIVRTVLARGLALTLTGIAAGTAGAWAATRLLQAVLYGVTPADPATFGSVIMLLSGVGTVACAAPAWRAMRVDPIEVLRDE
jgi:putative ABC transport system permease protein